MCSSKNLETLTHGVIEDNFGSPQIGWFLWESISEFYSLWILYRSENRNSVKKCGGAFLLHTSEIQAGHPNSEHVITRHVCSF